MKKQITYVIASFAGFFYGLAMLLLSRFFIANADALFSVASAIWGTTDSKTEHIVRILAQLKTAHIGSPWAAVLLIGALFSVLFWRMIRNRKRKALISCCVWIPLMLPLPLAVMLFTQINGIRPSAVLINTSETPSYQAETYTSDGDSWYFGFGRRKILPDENNDQPLYIAGYNSGVEITDVLDYCEARAVWLDTGKEGILLIGVDCVALGSGTIAQIRENLAGIPNCTAINIYATHTHAGIDTLGLWGPVAINGKNDAYMEALIHAATEAGQEAAANRTAGTLYFGQVETQSMYRDSRDPQVFDANLYQLRFSSNDGRCGLRLFFYGAHAESLRGDNTLLSRDFPGLLCDNVTNATGDDTMFFPGAIGGLIMTKEFVHAEFNAVENLQITADKLVAYALSIEQSTEQEIPPTLAWSRKEFVVPMDNTGFLLYKALGILNNKAVTADSATGYGVETELAILMLDNLALTLIPGEIFPELVYGGEYGDANPENENPVPLCQIAEQYGIEKLLVVGLCNDEIGYIVPPSDFLVNEKMPYLERIKDYKGEDHYEETNSIGPECANVIADTFDSVLKALR